MARDKPKVDPRKRALLYAVRDAYQAMGTARRGPEADRYHQALTAYVSYLRRDGGAAAMLEQTLGHWDAQRGACDTGNDGQLALWEVQR